MSGDAPEWKPTFPCMYSIMTQELADRKRAKGQKHIGIIPDGYSFYCETEKELDNYKVIYKNGNKYKNETITGNDIGRTEH